MIGWKKFKNGIQILNSKEEQSTFDHQEIMISDAVNAKPASKLDNTSSRLDDIASALEDV